MKRNLKKYLRKNHWIALCKVAKKRFANVPGDNFPVFALR
jgi:hypothetical protein